MITIEPNFLKEDSNLYKLFNEINVSVIDEVLEKTGDSWINKRLEMVNTEGNLQYILGKEKLNDLKLKGIKHLPDDIKSWQISLKNYEEKLYEIINKHFCGKKIELDSTLYYEVNDFMGWRTNSEYVGKILYLTWNKENNKSYFMWSEGNNLMNYNEPRGWSMKLIDIFDEDPHWYSVYSGTDRIEIGIKLMGDIDE
jgi:hypothetical protein